MVKIVVKIVNSIIFESNDFKDCISLFVGKDSDLEGIEFVKNDFEFAKDIKVIDTISFLDLKNNFDTNQWPEFFRDYNSDYFDDVNYGYAYDFIKNSLAYSLALVLQSGKKLNIRKQQPTNFSAN